MLQVIYVCLSTMLGLIFVPAQGLIAAEPTDDGLKTPIQTPNNHDVTMGSPEVIMVEFNDLDDSVLEPMQIPTVEGEENEYDEYIMRLCQQAEDTRQCQHKLSEIEIDRFKANHKYRIWIYNHYQSTFELRSIIDKLIFLMVIFVVMAGLYLSYLEFTKEDKPETKLTLAKGYIEIDSNVIGLIVLVVSLVFLYLYITRVCPPSIVELGIEGDNQSSLN